MRKVIFIPTAAVYDNQPSEWLRQRLDNAIGYVNNDPDVVGIVVSGRWSNATDLFEKTEAEVAKTYLIENGIDPSLILKEDLAVETGGNFAFSKPIIKCLSPDLVIIITSRVLEQRTRLFAKRIFGPDWEYEFIFCNDELSKNERAIHKEPKATAMFTKLLKNIKDGDDSGARDIFLYQTPFYYKGMIVDKEFFDEYWPGGFNDFIDKRLSIDNK